MTQPSENRRVFRTARWVIVLVAGCFVGCSAGAAFLFRAGGATLTVWSLGGLGLVSAVGLLEGLVSRVVLDADSLEIVSNFRRTVTPRSELVRAVAEKGCPIAIERASGGWIKLPASVAGPHLNTLRSWLRRTRRDGEA